MGDQEPNIVEYYFSFSNKLLSRVPTVPHDMKDFFGMSELFFFWFTGKFNLYIT